MEIGAKNITPLPISFSVLFQFSCQAPTLLRIVVIVQEVLPPLLPHFEIIQLFHSLILIMIVIVEIIKVVCIMQCRRWSFLGRS